MKNSYLWFMMIKEREKEIALKRLFIEQ